MFASSAIMSMRAISIITKSLFMLYIMSKLSLAELGAYNYSLILINILVILGGLDIYSYAQHKHLTSHRSAQIILHFHKYTQIICSLLLILVMYLLKNSTFIDWKILSILVASEYLLQEQYRYLVLFEENFKSNVQLFIRQTIWPISTYLITSIGNIASTSTLELIFSSWAVINILTYIYFSNRYCALIINSKSISFIHFLIIFRKAMKFSTPLLLGALSYKIVEYSDKYFLEKYHGITDLGTYSYLVNFSNILQSFIFVGVIAIRYQAYVKDNSKQISFSFKNRISKEIIIWSFILSAISLISFSHLNELTGKNEMNDYYIEFGIILFGTSLLMLSQVPHYYLFAAKGLRSIFYSSLIAAAITPIFSMLLVYNFGIRGAALSCILGSFFLLSFKTIGAFRVKR